MEERIVNLERELVGLKTGSVTQADSVNWHKLLIDLGAPPIVSSYTTEEYVHKIFVDSAVRGDNLLIFPVISMGLQRQVIPIGDWTTYQYMGYGSCYLDFSDPRIISVYVSGQGFDSGTTYTNVKNIYLQIYSNYALELISHTTTRIYYS